MPVWNDCGILASLPVCTFLYAIPMKNSLKISLVLVLAFSATGAAWAQSGAIFRCGNEYTNAKDAEKRGCKRVEGGNVTVIEGARPAAAAPGAPAAAAPANAPRVAATDQRARDSDSRAILETELRKAEARQAELQKEYNNGEPDKLGPETRNHQKYLDRVADLKASILRNESDIAGIKRELGRVPAPR